MTVRVLAVDTSTMQQSLALTDGPTVVSRLICGARNHADSLLRNIEHVLDLANWELASLDLIAVGIGPGSFTGLRVGMATAKGLAVSAGVPIVGVSSLAATARPIATLFDGTIVVATDARRREAYAASFGTDGGNVVASDEARTIAPAALAEEIANLTGPVAVVGDAFRAYEPLRDLNAEHIVRLPSAWDTPSGPSLAFLAAEKLEAFGPDDLAALEPDYVRPSDAEMNGPRR